jgi:hypothetical protein
MLNTPINPLQIPFKVWLFYFFYYIFLLLLLLLATCFQQYNKRNNNEFSRRGNDSKCSIRKRSLTLYVWWINFRHTIETQNLLCVLTLFVHSIYSSWSATYRQSDLDCCHEFDRLWDLYFWARWELALCPPSSDRNDLDRFLEHENYSIPVKKKKRKSEREIEKYISHHHHH